MSQGAPAQYWHLALFSAAMTIGIGVLLPYFPVWLAAQGLEDTQLALVIAVPALVRMAFNPPVGRLADRLGAPAWVLAACACITALLYACLMQVQGFWPILVVVVLVAAAQGPILTLADTLILAAVRQSGTEASGRSLNYGSIRAWGSAMVLVTMLAGGRLMGLLPASAIVLVLTMAAAITALATLAMAAANPRGIAHIAGPVARPLTKSERRSILALIVAAGLVQASHANVYTFATLDWQAAGLSGSFIGFLWAAGVFIEVLFFLFAGKYVGANPNRALLCLMLGAVASVMRWGAMLANPGAIGLSLLQMGHGLTFGATHLGAVSFLGLVVAPSHRAQAQAWLSASISLALFVATALCGPLHRNFGLASYGFMAILGALACLLLLPSLLGQRHRISPALTRQPEQSV